MTPWIGSHSVIDRPEFGEAGCAADDHHGQDQDGDRIEPDADGAAIFIAVARDGGRLRSSGNSHDCFLMAVALQLWSGVGNIDDCDRIP